MEETQKVDNILKGNTPNTDLYSLSWKELKGQWGISIGFLLLFSILSFLVSTIGFGILDILISAPLSVGSALFWLNLSRKSNPDINNMFKGFESYGAALGSNLLAFLIIIGGTLLLIIPGIIWGIQYSMINFIIADNPDCGGNEALIRSRKMMYGHKWKMFRFGLRAFGVTLLCCLTLGIGFLWGIPWISTAYAKFYDDIK